MEIHEHAIREKAEIMVDHFHEQVIAQAEDRRPGARDGGHGRHRAGDPVLPRVPAITWGRRKSPYKAIVAFSGEHEYGGEKVTEASLNGFPSSKIAERIRGGPVPVPDRAPTSSRPATTSRCCTRCTWTRCSRASRRCRRSRG